MKLSVKGLSLSMGILWGLCMLLMGLAVTYWGFGQAWFDIAASMYPGTSATLAGSFVGGVWGFVDGVICGAIFAWLYNKFACCGGSGCCSDSPSKGDGCCGGH